MKLIIPTDITSAMLLSSSVPEADAPEWNPSTQYAAGQRVVRAITHRVYEAVAATVGNIPEETPTKWIEVGATNRWAAFDKKIGTETLREGSISWTVKTGDFVTAVALLELAGATVTVTMTDSVDGVVFSETVGLVAPISSSDAWTYFFEDYRQRTVAIFRGFPSYKNAEITISVMSGTQSDIAKCGVCIVGSLCDFADAVDFGARFGILDNSKKTKDDWGNVQVTERSYSKTARWPLLLRNADLDKFLQKMSSVRAKPALYIGSELYDSAVIYGFAPEWDVVISYPKYSDVSITLEGLI